MVMGGLYGTGSDALVWCRGCTIKRDIHFKVSQIRFMMLPRSVFASNQIIRLSIV